MFLLNLTLLEFAGLFTAASAIVVALYLLNRARSRQTVSTLRFWRMAEQPNAVQRRRRIQQPISLLLQIVSILLLLLAISQLRLGSPDTSSRDHVLILDTSAWMGAHSSKGILMDEAKKAARDYIRALPATDRVILVRADALPLPATSLTSDRQALRDAINASRPGAAALNLEQAVAFGRDTLRMNSERPGEIAFVGSGRVSAADTTRNLTRPFPLRVLPVTSNLENVGIRQIGLRHGDEDGVNWVATVTVHNYGSASATVPVAIAFGNAPAGSLSLTIPPSEDRQAAFPLHSQSAGWIEARVLVNDALEEDNRAILEIPREDPITVAVYTDDPGSLRPALAATPRVNAVFYSPAQYDSKRQAQIVILDRFRPTTLPDAGVLWIEPPPDVSPVRVRANVDNASIVKWKANHVMTTGLYSKQVKLDSAEVFTPASNDISIAEVQSGPVIIGRPGDHRQVVIGFHPGKSMRFDLATPILFANILRWITPELFRKTELYAGAAGPVTVPLESDADPAKLHVTSSSQELPFTLKDRSLRFFAGAPGIVEVTTDDRRHTYSLTLPEVGETVWQAPPWAKRGLPAPSISAFSRDLWPILALLGMTGLLAEYLLYGRNRRSASVRAHRETPTILKRAS